MRRLPILTVAIGVLLAPLPSRAAGGGTPIDYADTSMLGQPVHATRQNPISIPMRDGVSLYAEVTRPADEGEFPVILEMSQDSAIYQGMLAAPEGSLADYFAPRGYAVVVADARGTGRSSGCPDPLGDGVARDGYDAVEWLASEPSWSSGAVAMTGFGGDGSFALATASAEPPHLETIVAVGAHAQAYDERFQGGVPYSSAVDWALASGGFSEPGWFRSVTGSGCDGVARAIATLPDHATGRYTAWHGAHDYRARIAAADVPIFAVQGLADRIVHPLAIEWLFARGPRAGDKVWLGHWAHRTSDRGRQWPGVLHRWLESHLKGAVVDTGPRLETFLNPKYELANLRDLNDPANWMWRGKVRTSDTWPATTSTITFYPSLDLVAGEDSIRLLSPTPVAEGSDQWVASTQGRGMIFESPPFAEDTLLAGLPDVLVNATIFGERVDLIVSLYEVGFSNRLITQAALNPELRTGLDAITPVVPGQRMRLRLHPQPVDYLVHEGSILRMFVSSNDPDKAPLFAGPGAVQIHFGGPDPTRVAFGIVDPATLYEDPRPKA